jgi:serine phosphatase RsbU (regulator of sigma subunit)/tetratricopeptide (TPR) repeat protein
MLLLSLITFSVYGQHDGNKQSREDSLRVILYASLDSLFSVQENEDKAKQARFEMKIAKIYLSLGMTEDAIRYYTNAEASARSVNDSLLLQSIYYQMGQIYSKSLLHDKAGEYFDRSQQLKESTDPQKIIILKMAAINYDRSGNSKKALILYEKLADMASETKDTVLLCNALSHQSNIHKKKRDFEKSLKTDLLLEDIYTTLQNDEALHQIQNAIAYNYFHLKNYEAGSYYFQKSIHSFNADRSEKTLKTLVYPYINLGVCYQNIFDYNKAIEALNHARRIGKDEGMLREKTIAENILANIYLIKGDYYNASLIIRDAVQTAEKLDDKKILLESYLIYSKILKAGNDPINALNYYERYLALNDSMTREKQAAEHLYQQKLIYHEQLEKQLKMKRAEEEMQDLTIKKVQLESEKKEKELVLLKRERELEKSEKERLEQALKIAQQAQKNILHEKEIMGLEKENKLKEQKILLEEKEKKRIQQENKLLESEKKREEEARKRVTLLLFFLILIAMLIFGGLLALQRKNRLLHKQKQIIEDTNLNLEQKNEEITVQRDLIETKNSEITASINYAKRIQEALLPDPGFIKDATSDSFVFFLPKDIVSGDFYWGGTYGDRTFILAADCTGHGVPGAFMSMLGNSYLSEIINENKHRPANEILNLLRAMIIRSLKQEKIDSTSKDGMDAALCIINKKEKTLEFAGANNPLYHIRNETLSIIKGDRMPVGIHMFSEKPFTQETIRYNPGDVFYVFSDGFPDQFGGEKGKKYKYIPFRNFLLSIHKKPFHEQKKILHEELTTWMGDQEQVDDILVIGFKV